MRAGLPEQRSRGLGPHRSPPDTDRSCRVLNTYHRGISPAWTLDFVVCLSFPQHCSLSLSFSLCLSLSLPTFLLLSFFLSLFLSLCLAFPTRLSLSHLLPSCWIPQTHCTVQNWMYVCTCVVCVYMCCMCMCVYSVCVSVYRTSVSQGDLPLLVYSAFHFGSKFLYTFPCSLYTLQSLANGFAPLDMTSLKNLSLKA